MKEVRKRKTIPYDVTYMWNLKHATNEFILQNRDRLTENRLVAKGEGKDWEFGISKRKLLYIGWINNKILLYSMCVCAKSLQLCPTVCNPMNYSLPGSSVQGILQARILEWIAMPSSRGFSWPRDGTGVSWCLLHWQVGSLPLVPPGKPTLYSPGSYS